jgi:localization factor PodJL
MQANEPAPDAAPLQTAAVSPAADAPDSPPPQLRPVPAELPPAIGPAKLRDAAMAGDPVAAFEVAARYAEGRSAPQDISAAVAWYRHAAESGLHLPSTGLGPSTRKGSGRQGPCRRAGMVHPRRRGRECEGHAQSGGPHAEGAGGAPDLERAAKLFRQAAEHGVATASSTSPSCTPAGWAFRRT